MAGDAAINSPTTIYGADFRQSVSGKVTTTAGDLTLHALDGSIGQTGSPVHVAADANLNLIADAADGRPTWTSWSTTA